MEGFFKSFWDCPFSFRLRSSAMDRQYCTHIWFPQWPIAFFCFPALYHFWYRRQISQTGDDHCLTPDLRWLVCFSCDLAVCVSHQLAVDWISNLLAFHNQVLREVWLGPDLAPRKHLSGFSRKDFEEQGQRQLWLCKAEHFRFHFPIWNF